MQEPLSALPFSYQSERKNDRSHPSFGAESLAWERTGERKERKRLSRLEEARCMRIEETGAFRSLRQTASKLRCKLQSIVLEQMVQQAFDEQFVTFEHTELHAHIRKMLA